ncbi:MAG: hypothetical protein ACT4P6_08595, partial [Gemmatimonadaceae bacterium]
MARFFGFGRRDIVTLPEDHREMANFGIKARFRAEGGGHEHCWVNEPELRTQRRVPGPLYHQGPVAAPAATPATASGSRLRLEKSSVAGSKGVRVEVKLGVECDVIVKMNVGKRGCEK